MTVLHYKKVLHISYISYTELRIQITANQRKQETDSWDAA